MGRIFLLALTAAVVCRAGDGILLRQGWWIQQSTDVRDSAETISSIGYEPRNWYPANVPSTVFNALVESRVYPDPYFGMNLRSVAGTSYPISTNFSNADMPPDSPFRHSWWYRTEFKVPAEYRGKTIRLGFDGINFRANVWLNGHQIASSDKMAGAWRIFDFDVTGAARPGEENALAIEVFAPTTHDLAITFVDWNPMPPDKGMGIWRDVHLTATGPVALSFPSVTTHLNLPSTDAADLTVSATLHNASGRTVDGVLKGSIESLEFSQEVKLGGNETRTVRLTPLKITHPRLWWPAQVGAQELYPLSLTFEINGQVSDTTAIRFGIREVSGQVDDKGHLLFQINGKKVLIRGAGYTFDMLLRSSRSGRRRS